MPPNMAAMAGEAQPPQPAPQQGMPPQEPQEQRPDLEGPELEQAFEEAKAEVGELLYKNTDMSDRIIKMADKREKVGSVAKAVVLVVTELDKQVDFPEEVLAGITAWTADRVIELVTEDASVDLEYNEKEAKQVVMTATELMLDAYGVTPEERQMLGQGMKPEQLSELDSLYKGALNG